MGKLAITIFLSIGTIICFTAKQYSLAIFLAIITIIMIAVMRRKK